MNITFLLPHLKIAGGTRVLLIYANALAKRGHKVNVLVQSKKFIRRFLANLLHYKPRWISDFWARILRVPNFDETNIPDADLIIASAWQHALLIREYPDNKGIKVHFIQHDERLYHGDRKKVDESYRLPFKKIVVSSWLKEMIKREYGFEAELLLNTVDRNIFYPVEVKKEEDSVRILILDHDYEWKGTKEGVEVFKNIKKNYPNLKLIMFGARRKEIDLPCDEYYYNLPQKKLAWLYSSCHIFLCSSWDEGFGLPSLEAMASKCTVVTYDNGGCRDYAFDGQTAFVAKRRDMADLETKLELAVKDKVLRERIAENGYQFTQEMPTWEEQAEKLENIFKKALETNAQ